MVLAQLRKVRVKVSDFIAVRLARHLVDEFLLRLLHLFVVPLLRRRARVHPVLLARAAVSALAVVSLERKLQRRLLDLLLSFYTGRKKK